jgi:hypothetical protein
MIKYTNGVILYVNSTLVPEQLDVVRQGEIRKA